MTTANMACTELLFFLFCNFFSQYSSVVIFPCYHASEAIKVSLVFIITVTVEINYLIHYN